jgi:hypothetical protein
LYVVLNYAFRFMHAHKKDHKAPTHETPAPGKLSMQEAINLQRQAFLHDKERQEHIQEKKRRLGMPIEGEVLSKEEREARIWAFM